MPSEPRIQLPPPLDLERTCRGLAALDAALCEEWDLRYYSFNGTWDGKGQERMASMRNGCGDEWFILFSPAGVFVKAFWHEFPHEDPEGVYAGLPPSLASQLAEPAFSMDCVTFGGWHDGTSWTLRGNPEPMAEEIARLTGDPEQYRAFAAEYFEVDASATAIAHVLSGKPLDAGLLAQLGSDRSLDDLAPELEEIGC